MTPHVELVTGGAQVEASAHIALELLDRALDHPDPTAAGELIATARDSLAGGLGRPRRFAPTPWDAEEEGDRAAEERRIDDYTATDAGVGAPTSV